MCNVVALLYDRIRVTCGRKRDIKCTPPEILILAHSVCSVCVFSCNCVTCIVGFVCLRLSRVPFVLCSSCIVQRVSCNGSVSWLDEENSSHGKSMLRNTVEISFSDPFTLKRKYVVRNHYKYIGINWFQTFVDYLRHIVKYCNILKGLPKWSAKSIPIANNIGWFVVWE